jgi:DnaJ family protein A protein 2
MAQFFFGGSGGSPFGDFGGHGGPPRKTENKYYDLVGATREDTCDVIKKKFRKKARTAHPDKGGDPKIFAAMTHAADVLSDPEKRKVYDQYGEDGINKGMASNDS